MGCQWKWFCSESFRKIAQTRDHLVTRVVHNRRHERATTLIFNTRDWHSSSRPKQLFLHSQTRSFTVRHRSETPNSVTALQNQKIESAQSLSQQTQLNQKQRRSHVTPTWPRSVWATQASCELCTGMLRTCLEEVNDLSWCLFCQGQHVALRAWQS